MVRVTHVLSRIPVIKFRKGGLGLGSRSSGAGSSAPQQAASPSSAGSAAQCKMQAAAMSTSSIPDIDLPLRYRRMPLSEEEIEHINGGGIV